jgi:hypothetical protein
VVVAQRLDALPVGSRLAHGHAPPREIRGSVERGVARARHDLLAHECHGRREDHARAALGGGGEIADDEVTAPLEQSRQQIVDALDLDPLDLDAQLARQRHRDLALPLERRAGARQVRFSSAARHQQAQRAPGAYLGQVGARGRGSLTRGDRGRVVGGLLARLRAAGAGERRDQGERAESRRAAAP